MTNGRHAVPSQKNSEQIYISMQVLRYYIRNMGTFEEGRANEKRYFSYYSFVYII